jgi:hypothetical protein
MNLTLPLTPSEEARLIDQARARGTTPEHLVRQAIEPLVVIEPEGTSASTGSALAATERILELQEFVQPDPEGWTVLDYINRGRP